MNRPDLLRTIVENGQCNGCGACVSALGRNDITMRISEDGYLRPTPSSLNPTEQNIVHNVCAGQTIQHGTELTNGSYHPLWGNIRMLATGHATDPEVRHRGSSGGVISALCLALVESGDVEFILSTSASTTDPLNTMTQPNASREMVLAAAGSRYAPSAPLAELEYHLAEGRRFAVVGKPCDIAALRRMAQHDPRIDAQIPYKFAFFCAGVPSRLGTLKVLEALGVKEEEVVSFQYRGNGWPGLTKAVTKSGREASMDYNGSWGTILNKYLQFRCKICPDGTGEFADIACADAWYGQDGYPDFTERDGRSLIIARTAAGQQLLDRAMAARRILTEPLDVEQIALMQPYQVTRKRNVLARAMGVWLARRQVPRYGRLRLILLALRTSPVEQLRNLSGTFKRSRGRILS